MAFQSASEVINNRPTLTVIEQALSNNECPANLPIEPADGTKYLSENLPVDTNGQPFLAQYHFVGKEPRLLEILSQDSYEEFFKKHAGQMFSLFWRSTKNWHDAEELTQEVFLKAWKQVETGGPILNGVSWLFQVATNLAIDTAKHQKVVTKRKYEQPGKVSDVLSDPAIAQYLVAKNDVEAEVLRAMEFEEFVRVLARTSEKSRVVIKLLADGFNYEEIAAILGLSHTAVKMRVLRGRRAYQRFKSSHGETGVESA